MRAAVGGGGGGPAGGGAGHRLHSRGIVIVDKVLLFGDSYKKHDIKAPVPNVDVATQEAASRRAGPGPRRRSARPRWRAARRRRSSQQAARGRQPSTHISLTSRHYPAFCGFSCNLHIILDIIYETVFIHQNKRYFAWFDWCQAEV